MIYRPFCFLQKAFPSELVKTNPACCFLCITYTFAALPLFACASMAILSAVKDTELKGTNIKGIINRLRYATNGASYGMLTLFAAKLVFDTDPDNSSSLRKTIITAMLENPWGYWLVILAAITIALGGAYYINQGLTGSYQQKIKEVCLKDHAEKIMIKAGKAGYAARGIVWIIVGYLMLRAALNVRRGGIQNAFQFLENSFYGSYLLGGSSRRLNLLQPVCLYAGKIPDQQIRIYF